MRNRYWKSRQQLLDNGLYLTINEKGRYAFWQKREGREPTHLTVGKIISKKKYGKDVEYPAVSVYFGRYINSKGKVAYRQKPLLLHIFVWLWFKNEIPDGWVDIDHIDGNKWNFSPDNLQLITRKENLAKRGPGRNQHSVHWTDEEITQHQEALSEKEQDYREYRKIRDNGMALIKQLRAQVNSNQEIIKKTEQEIEEAWIAYRDKNLSE